jgi:hypothetical protein
MASGLPSNGAKIKELAADFPIGLFVDRPNMSAADGGQRYPLSREKHVQVDGK